MVQRTTAGEVLEVDGIAEALEDPGAEGKAVLAQLGCDCYGNNRQDTLAFLIAAIAEVKAVRTD